MKPKNPKETSLTEIENFAAAELNSFIRSFRTFYAEVRLDRRRMNGELNTQNVKRSMNNPSLWAAKAFQQSEKDRHCHVNDTQFKEANEMFHAMLVKLKTSWQCTKTQFLRKTF